jgi:hypothetical protein
MTATGTPGSVWHVDGIYSHRSGVPGFDAESMREFYAEQPDVGSAFIVPISSGGPWTDERYLVLYSSPEPVAAFHDNDPWSFAKRARLHELDIA